MWIYGNGGHAKVIRRMLGQHGPIPWNHESRKSPLSMTSCGATATYNPFEKEFPWDDSLLSEPCVIAVGNNKDRKRIVGDLIALGYDPKQFSGVHDHDAITSLRHYEAGVGNVYMARVVTQPGTKIGNHTIINTGSTVDHDCVIGDFVHIAPGVNLCGGVQVGEGTLIGVGSCVTPGVKIGPWLSIRAGSVITRDVMTHDDLKDMTREWLEKAQRPAKCVEVEA